MLSHSFVAFHMDLPVKKMMPQTGEQGIMESNIFCISPEDTTNLPHAYTLGMKCTWKILLLLHLLLPVLLFQHKVSMHHYHN